MAGLRVVRGPDWKWDDQDGGNGMCGTVYGGQAGTVKVLWDEGRKNVYRAGAEDSWDLRVLDNGPCGVNHPGVSCDVCSEQNIRGLRWKCADCPDYDLCTECYGNDRHDMNHKFVRFDTPSSDRVNVGKRQSATKVQSRGLYKGATVVRGEDWNKGNQDGGVGNTGKITKVGYVNENIEKAALVVEWTTDSGTGYIYRRGLGGNVDVKCTVPAIGWGYYRDHLPELRDVNRLSGKTSTSDSDDSDSDAADLAGKLAGLFTSALLSGLGSTMKDREAQRLATLARFSTGDIVKLSEDFGKVKALQDGHGGFNGSMIGALGKTGMVVEIDGDGDVIVTFGKSKWVLNPDALTKVDVTAEPPKQAELKTMPSNAKSPFETGDKVVINQDEETVRRLQNGHGGWSEAMKPLVNSAVVGIVRSVDEDNDLKVAFGDKNYLLNPEICSFPPKTPKAQNVGTRNKLKVGDSVTMDKDIDFVKRMQRDHGGWDPTMKKAALTVGTVQSIDSDGDVEVKFDDNVWLFNPESLRPANTAVVKQKNVNKDRNEQSATSVGQFSKGDYVRLDKELDNIKRKQHGHGGWADEMKKLMTMVGRVVATDEDGDLKVKFGDKEWTLNPEVCHKAAPQESGHASTKVKDTNVKQAKTGVARPSTAPASARSAPRVPSRSAFHVDEQVKIQMTSDKLKSLQRGHGDWNEKMAKVIGEVGVVQEILKDGDMKVKFPSGCFSFNPAACTSLDAAKSKASGAQQKPTLQHTVSYECGVCLDRCVNVVFNCGHSACSECAKSIDMCHMCCQTIALRTKMFL